MFRRLAPRQTVDRLIGIAGHRQVGVVDRHGPHDGVLGRVGVLVFIDQNVLVSLVEGGARLRILAQERRHVQQQVVEIDRVGSAQPGLVHRVNLRYDRAQRTARPGFVLRRGDQVILRPTDCLGHGPRFLGRQVARRFLQSAAQHAPAVAGVVNHEIRLQADQIGVTPQEPRRSGGMCSPTRARPAPSFLRGRRLHWPPCW